MAEPPTAVSKKKTNEGNKAMVTRGRETLLATSRLTSRKEARKETAVFTGPKKWSCNSYEIGTMSCDPRQGTHDEVYPHFQGKLIP